MVTMNLIGSYNYALVALSVLIAMFASYAALDLAGRVTAASGWTRAVWLLGGAGAMGTGIWCMHYIGMLAFSLPIPVAYHWPTVLLSLFAAIFASITALYVVSREKMSAFQAVAGSVLMGAGIASMHYIGMAALRLPAICQLNSFLVVLSVVFAVLISLAALWITFHFRNEKTGIGQKKLAGAVVMGAAIPVMHYTGMAAASFKPSGVPADLSNAVGISALGTAGIAAVTFVVLGLALLTSWVDRRFAAQTLELQEEKLQRSEAYLAEAQRLSCTGSFGWNPSTSEIIWSEETFRIFQYDRTTTPTLELILQRVHPEDVALVQQTIERATQDGKDFDHEYRLMMPDGSLKHLHVVARALNNEPGAVEFVGAVMDVTERKRAAEALLRTEAYLAEGQKLSHTGTWACNIATREMIHSSEEHRHLFGLVPERVGIPPFEEFYQHIHPHDRGPTVGDLERAMAAGTGVEAHFRVVLPEGTTRYMYGIGHPLVKPSGETVEFVGSVMDVTAAKQSEEALRRSESYLAEAQKLTHTGSWVWDVAKRRALYISEEWYCIYGFDPEQGMLTWEQREERIHPDDRARQRQAIERAINEKSDYDIEYRILLPDGSIRHLHSVGHPVLDAAGNLVQFVGSSTDITERRQAEEALRQARADLARISRITTMGELTASLAHEVNQPIAAAVTDANTCMRWLTRDQPNLEEAREAASRVAKDATRAADMIRRIRLLFNKGSPQRELVDINEVVREMVVLLRSEATPYSVSIQTELAGLPQIMADRVQLQQVLMNLMINAIDAMKDVDEPRELFIRSQQAEDSHVMVSTSDTGVGLPPQQADQIFNAFFTTKPHGTGMGLRISRSIIESHGGRLWAADNSPRGASFCFTLPTKAEAAEDTRSRFRSVHLS